MDTILFNGNFYSLDEMYKNCTAVAIKNGIIIRMGNDEEILYNLPEGKWKILVDDKTAGADGKKNISEKTDVEPLSALVLEKE